MKVLLASQSPRRLFLLESAGFTVDVRPSNIDEKPLKNESAQAMTARLCREKATACDIQGQKNTPVIAADTLVAVNDQVLGQPKDMKDVKRMIRLLSGNRHQVHTTVCVRLNGIYKVETVTTEVCFRRITESEIDVYVQHNDILDKAGAYAIQGGASRFIQSIQGSLDNVIGLPVTATIALIASVQKQAYAKQEV